MTSKCLFEFDRPEPIYYSGETIYGRVTLTTTKNKSVREVFIQLVGQAKVRWKQAESGAVDDNTQSQVYRASELYLNTRTNVFPEGTLPAGTHVFEFQIPLPLQCPTSCMGAYGMISYELSLVLNRPFRFNNCFNIVLIIIKQLDLNMYPQLLIPLRSNDVTYFCCFPCSSSAVITTLTIPFGGYAPGQQIKYTLTVDNKSNRCDLEGMKLKLRQNYRFTAHSPHHKTRESTIILSKMKQAVNFQRGSKFVVEGELTVPPVPPSSDTGGIIQVSYDIQMFIKTGSCHTDAEMRIPIIIGTIPLAQSVIYAANATTLVPTRPSPGRRLDKPPSYKHFLPPSFEAATARADFYDDERDPHLPVHDCGPKYPMYTNFVKPDAPSH